MHIFYTKSVNHLKRRIESASNYQIITFADNELLIKIDEPIAEKIVWVLTATPAGHDALIELFFLLDVLKRMGAQIKILFTYFGYARQEIFAANESGARNFILDTLHQFHIKFCGILHMHRAKVNDHLTYTNFIPMDFFLTHAHDVDYIVAPDKGAADLAIEIANAAQKPYIILKKTRIRQGVTIDPFGFINITNKKILIVDDIIATAQTILTAARVLYNAGAKSVEVAATHGLFVGNALPNIYQSAIKNIFVTNSLQQTYLSEKIHVWDISAFIKSIMNQSFSDH